MKYNRTKFIEYQVTTADHNVDCVDWRTAKKLIANPPNDLLLIERVTRYGDGGPGEEELLHLRKEEILFERDNDEAINRR